MLCPFNDRIMFRKLRKLNWLIIIFISQLCLLSACENTNPSEKHSDTLIITDTLQIPVIGNNEYVRIDETGSFLLIRRKDAGITLYDLKSNSIVWEKENEELAYLGDPTKILDIVEDNVITIGYQSLSVYSLSECQLKFTKKLPKSSGFRFKNYPIFKTTINDQPYILTTYNIGQNGWAR